jgi:hypothetical protein
MTQVLFNIQKCLAEEREIFFFRGERLDDGVLHCMRPAVRAVARASIAPSFS